MENKMKLTPEMFEKCKTAVLNAKSAEEILAFAKQNDVEMSAEEAADIFAKYHKSGELSDDELDNVAGGGCGEEEVFYCETCGHKLQKYSFGWHHLNYACPVCRPDLADYFMID